jgi:acyl-CoA hydrolase
MDEALGWALYYQNQPAVTARAETRFHKPVPVGADVVVRAWVVRKRRRLFETHAEVRMEDPENTLLAETNATMYRVESADTESKQEEQEDVFA